MLALLETAGAELASDSKPSVIWNASAALTHALAGQRDKAMERIDAADRGREAVPDDGSTQRGTLYILGLAALLGDEPE